MNLKLKILKIIRSSDKALYVREICSQLNNRWDCNNLNGQGQRCFYCYKRGDAESKNLVKPPCQINYLTVLKAVKVLEREGKIKTALTTLKDDLSTWRSDRFRLCYIDEAQLRKRFNCLSLEAFV